MLYRKGSILFNGLHDQSKVWKQVLSTMGAQSAQLTDWFRQQNFGQVLYVGTSNYYNMAISAAQITHLVTGLNSIAITPSELMFGRRPPYDARIRTLVVALSAPVVAQEVGWGLEKLKQIDPRAQTMSLEVEEASLEAELTSQKVVFPELKESTKITVLGASGILLACTFLVGLISGKKVLIDELNRLPDIVENRIKDWQVKAQQLVINKPGNIAFLASGPFEGVAREAAYLMARIAGIPSTSNYFLEFRHGYYGFANNQSLLVGMLSNTFRAAEARVMGELAVTRAQRAIIAEDSAPELETCCDDLLALKSGSSEIARVLLMLPVVQFMTFYMAMSRGINPDNPKHLEHPRFTLKDKPGTK